VPIDQKHILPALNSGLIVQTPEAFLDLRAGRIVLAIFVSIPRELRLRI
jgi:hypothetical protein